MNIVIGANPSKFCIGDKCEARTVLWAAEFSSSMIDGHGVAGIYLLPSCFESVSWIVACVHALWWRLYVTSYTAWQATLHGKLHCMTSYTAWRATLHDKLRCMASYTAWQATLHDELHCMTSYAAWQATLHDKLHCMTSYTAWQATLHDKLHYMTSYTAWRATLHDKLCCMTSYPAWQATLHGKLHCMTSQLVCKLTAEILMLAPCLPACGYKSLVLSILAVQCATCSGSPHIDETSAMHTFG